MATIREVATPAEMNTDWYDHYVGITDDVQRWHKDGIHLDAMGIGGDTDETKLTLAIAEQTSNNGSSLNYPPIILPNRPLSFTTPRSAYSGLKIIGAYKTGQNNAELNSGNYSGSEITLGGSISSGTSSWWNGTGDVYNVFMADFAVQGSQGSSLHQFWDQPSGTLYACEYNSLTFNFMRGVMGRKDRKCLMTQVFLTGTWTINNIWDTALYVGGSDCGFWDGGYLNMGPSLSPAQTGTYADNDYEIHFDSMGKSTVGFIYASMMNGWRGAWISGAGTELTINGGVYEGYKPNRVNGLLSSPAPGTVMRIDDGAVNLNGTHFGQYMDNPDAAENGGVQINGGEVNMSGCSVYGLNGSTSNFVDHNGGRLAMNGILRKTDVGWTNRPRVSSAFTSNATDDSFYCPDFSVEKVA